jgi:hypothetical protein
MPIDSTSDGSAPIVGGGLENFCMAQPLSNLNQADSVQSYGNLDPHAEMNGIVLKCGSVHTTTVTANGATQTVNFPSTPDYNTVVTPKVPVSLKAGTNSVAIAHTAGTGPNLDRIVI